MKHSAPIIILTGGGSGGHITPLLSLAQELKQQAPDCQLVYIGHRGDQFDTLKESFNDFDFRVFIKAGKFRRYHNVKFAAGILEPKTLWLNLRDLLRLPGSIIKSIKILRKFKPDVVFSKGGFVAVPVGIAARLLKIPIITHDSDNQPGLANRLIGRWAVLHATAMPASEYSYPADRVVEVGIPLDPRIKKVSPKLQNQAREALKLPANAHVLLVSGGGNGSLHLNELVLKIAPELLETDLSTHIIHLTGLSHESLIKTGYQALPKSIQKRVIVEGFNKDFYTLAAAADLIITRAGATTLAELGAAGKAVIVIPSPFLAGGHQLKNAQRLQEADAAVVLPEEVEPDELLATVNSLLNNESRRFELARNLFGTAKPHAARDLAHLILKVAIAK